ncbi:MAG TPA: hypothetical protein VHC22_24910 [Pirellulales bacterium]|nr:hypothetical protein [Pirellulales bacterium]
MRFSAGLKGFVALLLLPVGAVCAADDDTDAAATRTADAPTAVQILEDLGFEIYTAEANDAPTESHRRHAYKNNRGEQASPPSQLILRAEPISATETPMERMQRLCAGEAELPKPMIVGSTLAEAMRRVAQWGDYCPFCGHAHADKAVAADHASAAEPKVGSEKLLTVAPSKGIQDAMPNAQALRPGEPAQVILDTQKRIGKSVLEGTEFGGSPDLLIQWIRTLDEENRLRQAALDDGTRAQLTVVADEDRVTQRSQVDALRAACHELGQVADMLEEQNLFDAADSIRGFADVLRRQSRQKLANSEADVDEPDATETRSEPRHANSKH